MRIRTCGEQARLVELGGLDDVLALTASLRAEPLSGLLEVVPAARTVLLVADPTHPPAAWHRPVELAALLTRMQATPIQREPREPVRIPVRYDGPDLHEVAELSRLTSREVVDRHTSARYTVAFTGFAPGFAYLTGLDPALQLPRRATPRTRVPAGSVAVADEYSAVYPRQSPGGWLLIGRTTWLAFDPHREPPGALQPLDEVRFEEVAA